MNNVWIMFVMCVCMCMCVHLQVCTCTGMCMCVCMCVCVCVCVCMYVCVCVCPCKCVSVYVLCQPDSASLFLIRETHCVFDKLCYCCWHDLPWTGFWMIWGLIIMLSCCCLYQQHRLKKRQRRALRALQAGVHHGSFSGYPPVSRDSDPSTTPYAGEMKLGDWTKEGGCCGCYSCSVEKKTTE